MHSTVLHSSPLSAPGSLVVVTGGAGYIGSALCSLLLSKGHRVRVLDTLWYGDAGLRSLAGNDRFELVVGDCRDEQTMNEALQGATQMVHLAAVVGDPACAQDTALAYAVNHDAAVQAARLARANGVSRFVLASTCSVYGACSEPADENSALRPLSVYARSKIEAEEAVLGCSGRQFHCTALRFATVFGLSGRPRFDLVVNLLTAKAQREGVITVFNGGQWRSFIHVRDCARAICGVLEAPAAAISGAILNCGDSTMNFTLEDVSATIARLVPNTVVEHVSNSDARDYQVSFERIHHRLGFECRWSLEAGITEIAAALSCGQIQDYSDSRYHNQRSLAEAMQFNKAGQSLVQVA